MSVPDINSKLLIFCILAFLIRVFFILMHPVQDLQGDEVAYSLLSSSILEGKGFSLHGVLTSLYPPLYPHVLAFFFSFLGKNVLIIKILQALLGSLVCVPIFYFSKRLFSEKIATVATLAYTLHFSLIASCNRIFTEALFVPLFMISLIIFLERSSKPSLAISGICLGLAALVRPVVLYLPILLLCIIIAKKRGTALMFIGGFVLAVAPWTLRNYHVHKAFVPITTKSGYMLYNSSHPVDGKKFGFQTPTDQVIQESKQISTEVDRDKFLLKKGIEAIVDDPLNYMKLGIIKLLTFFVPFDWELISSTGRPVFNLTYMLFLPFFFIGIYLCLFQKEPNLWKHVTVILLFGYFLLVTLFTYGSPRLRLPLEPLMIIYAAYGFLKTKEHTYRHAPALNSILLIYFLVNLHVFFYPDRYKSVVTMFLHGVGLW